MSLDPTYLGYRAASSIARLLPAPVVLPFSHVSGLLASKVMRGRADMVARHQRRVRGALTDRQVADAVRSVFVSYAHYWIESFRLPGTPPEVLDSGFTHSGWHHIQDVIDSGRSVVLAMPHLGAWEWAGFWTTSVQGIPVTTVVEAVEPQELAEWFTGLRREFGFDIIPLGPEAGSAAMAALKSGRILTLLCDRDVSGGGIEVDFFGERTTLPAGPATIALRSGAALVAATVYFDGNHHRGLALAPIDTSRHGKLREDINRVTQALADDLEVLIRKAPEQWHLLQPNWPSDLEAVGS